MAVAITVAAANHGKAAPLKRMNLVGLAYWCMTITARRRTDPQS